MAEHFEQFFPSVEAIAVNGLATNNGPYFNDINVNDIVAVIPKTWTDENQVKHFVFEVQYQETQKIKLTTYLFPRGQNQNVSDFLAIVDTVTSSDNNLTKYAGWVAINRKDIGTAKDILLNDNFIEDRNYRNAQNKTDLYVGIRQALVQQIFTVTGNQGLSFAYYYAY